MAFEFKKQPYDGGPEWWFENDLPNGGWFITPPIENDDGGRSEINISTMLPWHEISDEDYSQVLADLQPRNIHFVCTWEHLAEYASTCYMHGYDGALAIADSFQRLADEIRTRALDRRDEKWEDYYQKWNKKPGAKDDGTT